MKYTENIDGNHIFTDKKSEEKLIKEIRERFIGKNTKTELLLLFGDWSIKMKKQMRNYIPTPGIGLRRKIATNYKTLSIDEYKTSQLCSYCDNEVKKFKYIIKPNNDLRLSNSLLRCSNVACKNRHCDRDINGSRNILRIGKSYIKNKERLDPFKRECSEYPIGL